MAVLFRTSFGPGVNLLQPGFGLPLYKLRKLLTSSPMKFVRLKKNSTIEKFFNFKAKKVMEGKAGGGEGIALPGSVVTELVSPMT